MRHQTLTETFSFVLTPRADNHSVACQPLFSHKLETAESIFLSLLMLAFYYFPISDFNQAIYISCFHQYYWSINKYTKVREEGCAHRNQSNNNNGPCTCMNKKLFSENNTDDLLKDITVAPKMNGLH